VRPDPLPSLQVVRLFLRGTVNELQPLRTLSRKALSILLKIYKPHFAQEQGSGYFTYGEYRANAARAHTPLTRAEWSNTTFVDNSTITAVSQCLIAGFTDTPCGDGGGGLHRR
jgi:hypothetical protein